jgi:hypothetical protein
VKSGFFPGEKVVIPLTSVMVAFAGSKASGIAQILRKDCGKNCNKTRNCLDFVRVSGVVLA